MRGFVDIEFARPGFLYVLLILIPLIVFYIFRNKVHFASVQVSTINSVTQTATECKKNQPASTNVIDSKKDKNTKINPATKSATKSSSCQINKHKSDYDELPEKETVKRKAKTKTKLAQKDDELTLGKKVLLSS